VVSQLLVSQLSTAHLLALSIAAASTVGVTAYAAAGITAYVARPRAPGPTQGNINIAVVLSEPQIANRTVKAERTALLRDSPSYTNFDASLLAASLSPATAADNRRDNSRANWNGLLNDAQIDGIQRRLRLTPQQAERWPPVAAALRDLGRRYFQPRRPHPNAAPKIDVNSPEVQRLIETATPLIHQLSEEQKREVRQLVRIIGLEVVASQI
jgi:hypothetical protein